MAQMCKTLTVVPVGFMMYSTPSRAKTNTRTKETCGRRASYPIICRPVPSRVFVCSLLGAASTVGGLAR
jgi:hypothetical protein